MPFSPVLLVDDDETHVVLMRFAFTAAHVPNALFVAHAPEHAIELLENTADTPSLLITSIKAPQLDGFELLRWLQTQPRLRHIPKLTISYSLPERDIAEALLLGARAHFTQPINLATLVKLVGQWKQTYLDPMPLPSTPSARPHI